MLNNTNIIIIVILIFLFFTTLGTILRKSILLYLIIMFPFRRWHLPTWCSPKIKIKEYALQSENRLLLPDVYSLSDKKKYPGIIVFAPLAKEGKREPLVVNFLKGLTRIGYVVMVPFWPERSLGTVSKSDVDDLIASIRWFAKQPFVKTNSLGLVAVSFGVGPALIALSQPTIQAKIKYLVLVSGYQDLLTTTEALVTGKFQYAKTKGEIIADPYALYILFRNAGDWCKNSADQKIFYLIASLLMTEQNHPATPLGINAKTKNQIKKLKDRLTKQGQQIFDWITNPDSQQFQQRFSHLPAAAKKFFAQLTPTDKNLADLRLPTLILHSTYDHLIPYTESMKIHHKIKDQADSSLVLISAFDHTIPIPATFQNIWTVYLPNFLKIVSFIYKMLKLQRNCVNIRNTNQYFSFVELQSKLPTPKIPEQLPINYNFIRYKSTNNLQIVGRLLASVLLCYNENMVVKESKKLERVFKGVSNHRRIDILFLIDKNPNLTLTKIYQTLKCNQKTISEHTRKLVSAGLVNKKYRGREVEHYLSPYGEKIIKILQTF